MCLFVCMHAVTASAHYTCACMRACVRLWVWVSVSMCVCVLCACACMGACVCVYVYFCVHECVCCFVFIKPILGNRYGPGVIPYVVRNAVVLLGVCCKRVYVCAHMCLCTCAGVCACVNTFCNQESS